MLNAQSPRAIIIANGRREAQEYGVEGHGKKIGGIRHVFDLLTAFSTAARPLDAGERMGRAFAGS
jgi:hypothetical protein